jgi:hypothetical protein
MSEMKLKPCPFCGSKAERGGRYFGTDKSLYICSNKECPCRQNWFSLEQWNTRTPAIDKEKLVEWLRNVNNHNIGYYERSNMMAKIKSGEFDL